MDKIALIEDEIKFLINFLKDFNCDIDYIMNNRIQDRLEVLKKRKK